MKACICLLMTLVVVGTGWIAEAGEPMPTAFTYQGQLTLGGTPLNDSADFLVTLWDADADGSQIGSMVTATVIEVTDGLFSIEIDFGVDVYDGDARWVEIEVRSPSGSGEYTLLTPRQPITPVPYALQTRGLFVDDTNRLGIGTTAPKESLHNTGDYYGRGHLHLYAFEGDGNDGTAYIQARDDSGTSSIDLVLRTQAGGSSVNAVHMTNNGFVGIGTSTPAAQLHIQGSSGIRVSSSDSGPFVELVDDTDDDKFVIQHNRGGDKLQFKDTSGNNLAVLSKEGDLSVGDTSPNARIEAKTSGSNDRAMRAYHTASSGVTFGIDAESDSSSGYGVRGLASATSGQTYGVYGQANSASGWGVYSNGRLASSGTKSFLIDDPTAPTERYLAHYCVEGPEPQNVYNGVARFDANGEAWVDLPDYFEAINANCRYQLTMIGGPGNPYIAREVENNRFLIAGGEPGLKVSWEVRARRNDPFVRTHGSPVHIEKTDRERGRYLMPGLYGAPAELGIHYLPASAAGAKPTAEQDNN
jgi:hypothetical protein